MFQKLARIRASEEIPLVFYGKKHNTVLVFPDTAFFQWFLPQQNYHDLGDSLYGF